MTEHLFASDLPFEQDRIGAVTVYCRSSRRTSRGSSTATFVLGVSVRVVSCQLSVVSQTDH